MGSVAQEAETGSDAGVLQPTAGLHCCDESLRQLTLLGVQDRTVWSRCSSDSPDLCEAVREAPNQLHHTCSPTITLR